jgi:hypothetical protein
LCAGIHGDGGGGVVETDVAGADSHPSNVAVRVAAKAAFDVFEAVWPKHAATWVEEGMEPRWRRLVTHGKFIFVFIWAIVLTTCYFYRIFGNARGERSLRPGRVPSRGPA